MSETTIEMLADQAAISEVMHRYCRAVDGRDWDLLASCFTEDVEADFRSFGAREVAAGRDAWVAAVGSTVGGLDATQHLTGNHMHDLKGDTATLRADLQAVHILQNDLGDAEYTIGGFYTCDFVRRPDGWKIRRYTLTMTWQRGNRHILRLGAKKAAAA